MRFWRYTVALLAVATTATTAQQRADTLTLSLGEAVNRATRQGEEVKLAESQVDLAQAQIKNVRAGALPQISGNLGYTRTLASQFDTGESFTIPDSLKFEPDSLAPLVDRVKYLEDRAPTAGLGALGGLFGNLPFGRENAYNWGINGSQLLYSGGRVGAALDVAQAFRDAARFNYEEEVADIALNTQTAYFRAQLAQQLATIASAAVQQAEEFLKQERLRERAGTASDLDVLRAEVALANLRAQEVQARNGAEVATLDLRRLVNIPADQPVKLVTTLDTPGAARMAEAAAAIDWSETRPAVQAAMRQVRMRELGVKIARGNFLPSLSLTMNYGRVNFPSEMFSIRSDDWRTDWTAGLSLSVPIFDGLRRNSEVDAAQVELNRARLQLAQLREAVRLQYEQANGEKQRAAATIAAREQTVTQAQRVYDLTVLRYDRGLATQLDVSDARLALLQARTNLAQAISDFYIADATVARVTGATFTQ